LGPQFDSLLQAILVLGFVIASWCQLHSQCSVAGGDFDSRNWCCPHSVATLGHIDSNVGVFINSPHDRLTILPEVPADGKEDCL
jgi:hypothetical protein